MFLKYNISLAFIFFLLLQSQLFGQNQSCIDSIQMVLKNEPIGKQKVDLLNRLSVEYDDINVLQLRFAEQAGALAESIKYEKGHAEALANQGFYYFGQLRNPALAKPYFVRSIDLSRRATSKILADMDLKIGRYINQNAPNSAAKPYLLNSRSAYRSLGNISGAAMSAKELALVYAISHQKDSALLYLSEYEAYVRSTQSLFLLADWYSLASRLYGEFFNDENRQTEYFAKAASIYEKLQKNDSESSIYLAYARLHACKGNIHWLKNQLVNLKVNSLEVLRLCKLAQKFKGGEDDIYTLKWSAYISLIRSCISIKDEAGAKYFIKEGMDFFERQKDFYHLGRLLWAVESSYWRFSEYFKAYEYQLKELDTWDKMGNIYWKCIAMANKAMVFGRLGDYQRQIECISQLLTLSKANNVTAFTLYANKDLAKSYFLFGRFDSAQFYIKRAAEQNIESENPFITMVILYTEALLNEKQGKYDQAVDLLTKTLAIKKQYAYPINTYDQVAPENALARVYLAKGDHEHALQMALVSLQLSEKENMKDMQAADYLTLAAIYKYMHDYAKMSACLEKHIELTVDLAKDEAEKSIHKSEISSINKKNEFERALLLKEKDLRQSQLKIQLIWTWFITISFFFLMLLVFFLYKSYKRKIQDNLLLSEQKTMISEKNEELVQLNEKISSQRDNLFVLNEQSRIQHEEISEQNNMIIRQQKDITDSIVYASRIQQAMIPSFEELTSNFPNSFVLFLPRDIVSGDFYWVKQVRNQLYILVADCTGHGVPGAFMSMLGISLMNEMISSRHIDAPGVVLTELRKRLKRSLHQDDSSSDSKDGMDASLVLIDLDSNKLQFAGAYNPLYLIRKSGSDIASLSENTDYGLNYEITEIRADRMPIGVHPNDERPFTNQTVRIEKGDRLYLFSDGFVSQFGGAKGGKFKTKPFKELLLSMQQMQMCEQREKLFSVLESWRGDQWAQVDDILVLGLTV